MRVRAQVLITLTLVVGGVVLVATPLGDGSRVFELSPGYGPSPVDLLGVLLVLVGLGRLGYLVTRYLPAVRRQLGDRVLFGAALLAGTGFGVTAVSVAQGGPWWLTGLVLSGLGLAVLAGALASSTPG